MKTLTILLILVSLTASAGGFLSRMTVDSKSGTKTCYYTDGTTRVIRIYQSCASSGGERKLMRQEAKINEVGWRCWYSDGSYAESIGGCPRN